MLLRSMYACAAVAGAVAAAVRIQVLLHSVPMWMRRCMLHWLHCNMQVVRRWLLQSVLK
jgi:hypothetical protein